MSWGEGSDHWNVPHNAEHLPPPPRRDHEWGEVSAPPAAPPPPKGVPSWLIGVGIIGGVVLVGVGGFLGFNVLKGSSEELSIPEYTERLCAIQTSTEEEIMRFEERASSPEGVQRAMADAAATGKDTDSALRIVAMNSMADVTTIVGEALSDYIAFNNAYVPEGPDGAEYQDAMNTSLNRMDGEMKAMSALVAAAQKSGSQEDFDKVMEADDTDFESGIDRGDYEVAALIDDAAASIEGCEL